MQAIALLAQLNEVDLTIDALRARAAEIVEALKEPAALAEARARAAAAEAELARCRRAHAECERVQQQLAGRLAQAEQRLYSGRVRNPKELEDAEKDVGQQRRQLAQAEDALLDAWIALEAATDAQARAQAELARRTAEWEAMQAGLKQEQARLAERLAVESERQKALRRQVAAHLLHIYDGLRPRRAGRAVARLDDDTCSACLVAVSPGRIAAVRDGAELVYCENCGRILWSD
ncbi:MAG: C4-type zinc ribbon domain-containing protein [Anaerolineae bacterium]|nr:C4-type zinc ribbon domain-containing protein [Anaerolineae bacterium]